MTGIVLQNMIPSLIVSLYLFTTDNLPNLVDYVYRMKEKYWGDWESVTQQGKSYQSDHGKLYFSEHLHNTNGVDKSNGVDRTGLTNGVHAQ